jgi:phosphatidylethanolamine N-methyltransferase
MHKLYGDEIRKEAGLTKTLKSAAIAIPKSTPAKLIQQEIAKLISEKQELRDTMNSTKDVVKETIEKVEKAVEETKEAVGDMVEAGNKKKENRKQVKHITHPPS